MITVEIIFVFLSAWFMTFGYVFKNRKGLVWGILAVGCWWIVSWLWLFIDPIGYAVALFFFAVGIIILITVIIGMLMNLREDRLKIKELDEP